jgi:hypothetical protein
MNMSKLLLVFLMIGCLMLVSAVSPSIGIVKSTGEFRVNGAAVRGNGTLFDGNVLETVRARSVVELGETRLTLLPESRARIFKGRTILEKGSGLLSAGAGHTVEAANLRVTTGASSVLQVEISSPTRVLMAARSGAAEVRNASGVLVASLHVGMALSFDQQSGAASGAVQMTGTLVSRNGAYFLTDSTTKVTVELIGTDLAKYVGQEVEVTGSTVPGVTVAAGASQQVQVITIQPVRRRRPAGAGLSGGTTAAIIGGVAVGGAVAGLAAAGVFSGANDVSVP